MVAAVPILRYVLLGKDGSLVRNEKNKPNFTIFNNYKQVKTIRVQL